MKVYIQIYNMKKLLIVLGIACSALAACGGSREETDDRDSINAAKAADSMLQNELNADTSMNTSGSSDNLPTDSMQENSEK